MRVWVWISIHAPREGSDIAFTLLKDFFPISIHAPREGSDFFICQWGSGVVISIHAPREGSDFQRFPVRI